jgi:hypothetical protein
MRKNWLGGFVSSIGFVFTIVGWDLAYAGGTANIAGLCRNHIASSGKERAALASGYLEGVQAALNKDRSDILVPPEHPDHPVWWVLPNREMTADHLETSLSVFCKAKLNEEKTLLQAFLGIAARKEGSPRTGLPLSDGPSEQWRQVLEGSRHTCLDYASASDNERSKLIYGYFLGTKAVGLTLNTPRELSLVVWPETDPRDVKAKVDANCRGAGHRNSTVRDVLWLTTVEMGMERWIAGRQQNNRELLNFRYPD